MVEERRPPCVWGTGSVCVVGLRPLGGYAMARLRQRRLLLLLGVLVDSAPRVAAEHLQVTLFKFEAGRASPHCSVFLSPHRQSHLLPMNGCEGEEAEPPPPPPDFYCRKITWRARQQRSHMTVCKLLVGGLVPLDSHVRLVWFQGTFRLIAVSVSQAVYKS